MPRGRGRGRGGKGRGGRGRQRRNQSFRFDESEDEDVTMELAGSNLNPITGSQITDNPVKSSKPKRNSAGSFYALFTKK